MDDQRSLFERVSRGEMDEDEVISLVRDRFPSQNRQSRSHSKEEKDAVAIEMPRGDRLASTKLFDGCRVVPNVIARSGLFGVVGRGNTEDVKKVEIGTFGENRPSMTFSGQRLNQFDLDVWTSIVDMQLRDGGDPVLFSGYAMLKKLGRGTSKRDYVSLENSLDRLSHGIANFEFRGASHVGRFIVDLQKIDSGYEVWLNSVMDGLFEFRNDVTFLREDVRSNIKGALSKWLHAFIRTHKASPLKMKVENVREWCGSGTKQLYRFRQMLRRSLDELIELEVVKRYSIGERDVVCLYA